MNIITCSNDFYTHCVHPWGDLWHDPDSLDSHNSASGICQRLALILGKCVMLRCLVINKLVSWLSSVRNVGWLQCKIKIGPVTNLFKDDYRSFKKTKGRVKLFKVQGMEPESIKDWEELTAYILPSSCQILLLAWFGRSREAQCQPPIFKNGHFFKFVFVFWFVLKQWAIPASVSRKNY